MKNYMYETNDFVTKYEALAEIYEMLSYVDSYTGEKKVTLKLFNKCFAACVRIKDAFDEVLSNDKDLLEHKKNVHKDISKALDLLADEDNLSQDVLVDVSIQISSLKVSLKEINEILSLRE